MTKNTTWKRVAAGVLSLALVAGMMPANVGGFLTGGTAIVAHADDAVPTDTIQLYRDSDTVADDGTSRTYQGTYAAVSGRCVYEVFTITPANNTFTIVKASNEITNAEAVAGTDGIQQVTSMDNIVKPIAKHGRVQYQVGDGEWGAFPESFANNSTNTIKYKVDETDNYAGIAEGSFTVYYRDSILESEEVPATGSNEGASYRYRDGGSSGSIDVRGKSGDTDIQVTWANSGFKTLMSVDRSNYGGSVGTVFGKVDKINDVEVKMVPSMHEETDVNGEKTYGVKLTYTIANVGFATKNVRIGSWGDTMLNGNDRCEVKYAGSAIEMINGDAHFFADLQPNEWNTPQKLYVGHYSSCAQNMFTGGNAYEEGTDSGCAWSWEVNLPAGETRTYEVILSASCKPYVSYDLNYQGAEAMTSTKVTLGQTLDVADPSRPGYDFVNWTYTEPAWEEVTLNEETGEKETIQHPEVPNTVFKSNETKIPGSITLKANWKKHTYTYSKNDETLTITAECSNTEHPKDKKTATLTLNVPDTKNYDGEAINATLDETNDFIAQVEGATGNTIQIEYEGVGSTIYPKTTEAPTAAGNYKASVTVGDETVEKEFSILEKFDLSDDHTNDPLVRKNDNVRNVITSVAADLNGNGAFDADETATFDGDFPSKEVYYTQGAKVRVTSKAKLQFTTDTDKVVDFGEEYSSRSGYTYTFTVPYGVNIVTVKRIYKYSFRNDGTKQYGKDDNLHKAQEYLVAELIANDYEYLAPRETDVYLNVNPDFELAYDIAYSYTRDSAPVDDPQDIGAYHVIAQFSTNEQVYKIEDDFNITPRNYATHSGTAATETNEIKAVLGFESNKTVYNGGVQTPEVTVTDKLGDADTKTLERGTDYELGYLDNNGAFVKVDQADDAAKLGGTNVGEYKVYVNFINNYMNKVDGVEGPVELVWNIVAKAIVADDVTNPQAIQPLTYNAADQFLVSPGSVATEGEGASERPIGTVKYRLGADGEFSVNVPKAMNAGIYTVYWYVEGDSNHTNYGSEEQPFAVENIVIAPKAVQAADLTISTSNETFTYDGTEKKYSTVIVKDNGIRIDSSEYEVSYENNVNAGVNTAKVIISDTKTGETVGEETGNYTIVNPAEKNFSIAKATPTIEVQPKETITYDNAEVDVTDFTVNENNTDNHDVQLTFYADNDGVKGAELDDAPVNVGTYWAVVTIPATDNFNEVKSSAVKFTVVPRDISNVTITVNAADEPVADGENAKIPDAITVADGQINKTLEADTDFTVEYGNNIIAGSAATITLTGTGNYTGTATGKYNVLSVLDISEVKDLIQSIEYMNGVTNPEFEDTYKYRTNTVIKIKSTGVLKFGDLAPACVVVEEDLNYYYYELTIPDNTNSTKVTHIYNYQTDQHTDTNGLVTVSGVDNNIKNNTNWVPIATMSMDDVYYLDDADSKITVTDKEAPGITLGEPEYTYTKNSQTASIVNHKPVNAGDYRVQIKVNVTDGDGVEYVKVNMDFAVKPRPYDNNEIKVDIEQDEFT